MMNQRRGRPSVRPSRIAALAAAALLASLPAVVHAQPARQPLMVHVSNDTQRLEMTENTSRILTMDGKVPRAQVNNPDIVQLTPLSPTQIQVSALRAGVTQINLWDENDQVRSMDVLVTGDAQELVQILQMQFPTASLKVLPLQNSVVISGYVDDPQQVSRIIAIAQDKYPKVHNNIMISGVQQVRLDVQVMEVSRTKLRTLGVDWAWTNGSDFIVSSVGGLINAAAASAGTATGVGGDTVRFGIVNGDNRFFGFIEALKRNDLAKVLAEPKLVTVSGRPAYFNSGGEIPILVPQSLGTVSIEYKRYGTQVDFVPIVLGNGRIRLEVRPRVSELDSSRGVTINNTTVPGFRVREVDTAVEMQAGQTLALAGLVQTRVEARHSGVPWLSDLPWVGAGFRRVTEEKNEIELLIIVTPELVAPLDKHEFPAARPGLDTCSPNDVDLYYRGHIEVPCCGTPGCPGGANCQNILSNQPGRAVYPGETVPRGVLIQPEGEPTQPEGEPMLTDPQAGRGNPPRQPAQRMESSPAVTSNVSSRAASTRPKPRPAAPQGGEPGFIGPIGYDVER